MINKLMEDLMDDSRRLGTVSDSLQDLIRTYMEEAYTKGREDCADQEAIRAVDFKLGW